MSFYDIILVYNQESWIIYSSILITHYKIINLHLNGLTFRNFFCRVGCEKKKLYFLSDYYLYNFIFMKNSIYEITKVNVN